MTQRICTITGTRADYGILAPVMKAIDREPQFELQIIATCMHLMDDFGRTVDQIELDGFEVTERLDASYDQDSPLAQAQSLGRALGAFAEAFDRLDPDVVLVLGDRGEMLAAATAANYMGVAVGHIHGGEVSGHIDGTLRHAITKLSHLHFCATASAERRILNLGEESWRVFRVGAPALDRILKADYTSREELADRYGLDLEQPLILVLQHPVSTEIGQAPAQMKATLDAFLSFEVPTVIIYPNADAGGRAMIDVIRGCEGNPLVRAFKSIPHSDYLGLLRIASVLVGNSSSGIIEAPSFDLPVVNVGSRQEGRERAGNVIDVPCETEAITGAIEKALHDSDFRAALNGGENPYGCGTASKSIVNALKSVRIDSRLFEKRITY